MTFKISLVLIGILTVCGLIFYIRKSGQLKRTQDTIDVAQTACEILQEREEERKRKLEEERILQMKRKFHMDVFVKHGAAFGGFSATMDDGRTRRGSVTLDSILMHGSGPNGREYTYYIEEKNIGFYASDEPDTIVIRSDDVAFNIRAEGQSRGDGLSVKAAPIKMNVVYYIILESKHELMLRATAAC